MSVSKSGHLPKNGLQATRYALILLFSGISLLISLIANGRFDPQPLGELQWSQEPVTASHAFSEPRIVWLARPLPPPPYTIRLTAAWQSGHLDSAYGLALGNEEEYVLTAVTPTGYLLPPTPIPHPPLPIPHSPSPILPWPHINQLEAANEIWLDVTADSVTIRINGELYGEERLTVPPGGIGLWGMSWGETAVVTWQRLELYSMANAGISSADPCVSRRKDIATSLPIAILCNRSESKRRELEVKILAPALGHGSSVTLRSRHGAVSPDHVDHFLLRGPYGKGRDRARQPDCRYGHGCAWVVSHQFFDRPAPTNEAWYLGKFHPSQRHRHHGRGGILFANAFSKAVELTDIPPAALERHAHMPAGSQGTAKRRAAKKLVYGHIALPGGEHRQMTELHPCW
jgi:hypothetical protein